MTRLRPVEMSALALIASSKNCRMEIRQEILDSLSGDAKLIGTAILHGPQEGIGMTQVHRAAAAQLKDWADNLERRAAKRVPPTKVDPEVARHKRAADQLRMALEQIRDLTEPSELEPLSRMARAKLDEVHIKAKSGLLLASDEEGNETFYREAHAHALAWGYREGYIAALKRALGLVKRWYQGPEPMTEQLQKWIEKMKKTPVRARKARGT